MAVQNLLKSVQEDLKETNANRMNGIFKNITDIVLSDVVPRCVNVLFFFVETCSSNFSF